MNLCKYCHSNIKWIERKPFNHDDTAHTFDSCAAIRAQHKQRDKQEKFDKALRDLKSAIRVHNERYSHTYAKGYNYHLVESWDESSFKFGQFTYTAYDGRRYTEKRSFFAKAIIAGVPCYITSAGTNYSIRIVGVKQQPPIHPLNA